jgi:hypothetical protein
MEDADNRGNEYDSQDQRWDKEDAHIEDYGCGIGNMEGIFGRIVWMDLAPMCRVQGDKDK